MKCQILFSGKNKKNIINLSSAENAQRVVKVKAPHKTVAGNFFRYRFFCYAFCFFFSKEKSLVLHVYCLYTT